MIIIKSNCDKNSKYNNSSSNNNDSNDKTQ